MFATNEFDCFNPIKVLLNLEDVLSIIPKNILTPCQTGFWLPCNDVACYPIDADDEPAYFNYAIYNIKNRKMYVGLTEKTLFQRNIARNSDIYQYYKNKGSGKSFIDDLLNPDYADSFIMFSIAMYASKEEMAEGEKCFIETFGTYQNPDYGYNLSGGGELGSDNNSSEKKELLLDYAVNNIEKIKPSHPLYFNFMAYTNPNSAIYDFYFLDKFKNLRPNWFINTAEENKKTLIQEYQSDYPKPTESHNLWHAFKHYSRVGDNSYDHDFCNKVPNWTINYIPSAEKSVQEMKDMIIAGKNKQSDRPSSKTSLGRKFFAYTDEEGPCYRKEFAEFVKSNAPDWMLKQSDMCVLRQQQMLERAANLERIRPSQKTLDGIWFVNMIARANPNNKNYSIDIEKFISQCFQINPYWAKTQYDRCAQQKEELLKMASSDALRPACTGPNKTFLGCRLQKYTHDHPSNKSNYDPEFDAKIRKLRPDWFETEIGKAKQILISMLMAGQSRPKETRKPDRNNINQMLGVYHKQLIRTHSDSYDDDYVNLCKKHNPSWLLAKEEEVNINIEIIKNAVLAGEPRFTKEHRLYHVVGNYLKINRGGLKDWMLNQKSTWLKNN